MDETTLGFVDPDLARRLELCHFWRSVRYTQAYQRLHPQAQTAIFDSAGGLGVYVGPGSPLNNAGGLGLSGPVSAAELDELEDFYHARGDRVRLHFCPLADPSLLDLLRSRGYTIDGFFSVLVYRIPSGFSPAPLPPGVSLTRARPEQADEWLQVVAEGFEETASPSPAAFDILGPNFHAADSAVYFGWVDGQAAGGGGMYAAPAQRAVELGGASTRVAYRRRGVQRALIEARVAEAHRLGCDLAVVLTEPGSHSQRNLQRAGFALAYTKVTLIK